MDSGEPGVLGSPEGTSGVKRNGYVVPVGASFFRIFTRMATEQGKSAEWLEKMLRDAQIDLDAPENALESPVEELLWAAVQNSEFRELEGLAIQQSVGFYRVDFGLPELRIGFEVDGYEFHSDPLTFDRDRKRHRDIERQGWRLVRFSGREVVKDAHRCAVEMAAAVRVFTGQVPAQRGPESEVKR